MSDQDEDAFDHMHRVMASQGGHLVVVGEVIKERDAALAEVERLQGRLRELALSGTDEQCPGCGVKRHSGVILHGPSCWVAEATFY